LNTIYDMGGQHNYGPIAPKENDYQWKEDWEIRTMAFNITSMIQGFYNLDECRHSIERIPPHLYLTLGYYEKILYMVKTCLIENNILSEEEIQQRASEILEGKYKYNPASLENEPKEFGDEMLESIVAGGPTIRSETREPLYSVGDKVQTKNMHPTTHTRLPQYARGKKGTIINYLGFHVYADDHAHGKGEAPQPLYTVKFEFSEIWGLSGKQNQYVYLEMYEAYLILDNE
jgi:nitrile hydratase subunit beta